MWRTLTALGCAGLLLLGASISNAQDTKGKQGDKGKKNGGIDITAPRTPQPTEFPPPPEPSNPILDTQELSEGNLGFAGSADPFGYSGSPYNQFDSVTGALTGSPIYGFDSNRSYSTLDATRISELAPGTTPEIFQRIPGVLIQRTNLGGGSAIIRGRNGNQNLIMIDGVPINDAGWRFGNVQYLNTIDPGMIDRIEVIRGPASVLYGSGATGGVINIITKRRKNYEQAVGWDGGIITRFSSAQNSIYGSLSVEGNVRGTGVFASGSYLSTGALDAGGGAFFPNAITGYDQRAANLRMDSHLGNGWIVTFVFQHLLQPRVPRTDRFPDPDIDPTRFRNRPTFFDPQERNFGYLRFSKFAEDGLINGMMLTLSLQQRREGGQEIRLDRADQRERVALDSILTGGVDFRAFTYLSDYNTLTYGVTYYRDTVDSRRVQRTNVSPVFQPISPRLPNDGVYEQIGIFLMDRIEVTDWLALVGGLRWSNVNARGTANALTNNAQFFERHFSDWSAEFGAVAALTDYLHWNVTVAEGFRAPNLDDLAASDVSTARGQDIGTTTLATERGVNYETGLKYYNGRFQADVAYYYMDYESMIVRTPIGGGVNQRTNTGGFIHGVEAQASFSITPYWSAFASGSYQFGRDTERNEPISRIPPAYLIAGIRWSRNYPCYGLFFETWAEMATEQDRLSAADRNDIRIPIGGTPAWQTFNVRAGIDHVDYGRLIFGVYNIFDQNYRIHGSGLDAPGIEARIGYELLF